MSEIKKCEFCGKETAEMNVIDGHYCCNNCRENKDIFIVCPQFNDYVYKPLAVEVIVNSAGDTQLWCPEAVATGAFTCSDCGKIYKSQIDHRTTYDGLMVCRNCFGNYHTCSRCGGLFRESSDMRGDVCTSCWRDAERERMASLIHNYSYKPNLHFHGDSKLFMGFELESGNADDEYEMRRAIESLIEEDKENHFIFKHDGSIPGVGAELVSHPMTLEYHKSYTWSEVFATLENDGGLEPARGCGLHIHVNRSATDNWSWHKVDAFVNNYQEFCEMIAGRKSSGYYRYHDVTCSSKSCINEHDCYYLRRGHNTAVNTNNRNTIEFRIFQATFDVEELYARLEFIHALVKHAKNIKAVDVTAHKQSEIDKFVKFVQEHDKQYNNLAKYISKHYSK